MVEHVVNAVYVLVLFVYYWPFIAVVGIFPALEMLGLIESEPEWVSDTSWRGFWRSPYRLVTDRPQLSKLP